MATSRRRVTQADAQALVSEWRASGRSLPARCALRGLDGRSPRFWAGRPGGVPKIRVIERTPPARAPSGGLRVEVGDVTLVVGDAFCEETLIRALRAVRAC